MIKVGLHLTCYPEVDEVWNYLPPLGFGYLASYATKYVGGVEFIVERDFDALLAAKPEIIGIQYVTFTATFGPRQARKIKEALGCPVIAGGPHISTLPGNLPDGIDIAVLNEGEETFAELLRLYKVEGKFAPNSLARVKGILYRDEEGRTHRTPARPGIADLNTVPFPDRDLVLEKWRRQTTETYMMTSRGCPYHCNFCSTIKHWGNGYRFPSNDYVIEEMELIRTRYDPKILHIYDDLFVVRKDRVMQILRMMRERGLHQGVDLRCFVRSNLLDEELMEAFAETNFKILNVGFESASDKVLTILNKGAGGVAAHRKACDLARKTGLKFCSCFIMGVPGETREDLMTSFEFVHSNTDVLHCIQFAPLILLPGTPVWEWAKKAGVSETNLKGVALEPEDLNDEDRFFSKSWPYLNEEIMPREEFLAMLKLGRGIEAMIWKQSELNGRCAALEAGAKRIENIEYIAENVPISDIVRAKAKRRLKRMMPLDLKLSGEGSNSEPLKEGRLPTVSFGAISK